MDFLQLVSSASALSPAVLMLLALLLSGSRVLPRAWLWPAFHLTSGAAVLGAGLALCLGGRALGISPWVEVSTLGLILALLVQALGTVIGRFSARYLQGEAGQRRYVTALAGVLAAVHFLLLANHWWVLIAAWALVGVALQHLLCFYRDRPFALLAAHKKRIADRLADLLLLGAAALAWSEVGSGSLSDLWLHLGQQGMSTSLHVSAVCLVLAVILRTALLPVHGWLIQVMEAPTPVSALLHAGVVNLGGFVLIRFAPLLEQATAARWLLTAFGLATAVLAGLVMLTRISIKVRLAWSTVAQMGFMVMECGLGLYTLAALHLLGHSLYKAHAFLSASEVVRETRVQVMKGSASATPLSLWLAPALTVPLVWLVQAAFSGAAWPWWWSVLMGLAWAPLLWRPAQAVPKASLLQHVFFGLVMVLGLTGVALLAHALPLGLRDAPEQAFGVLAMLGMVALYLGLVFLQLHPQRLRAWRRWSYAGFYLDEVYTRLALRWWPTLWTSDAFKSGPARLPTPAVVDGSR